MCRLRFLWDFERGGAGSVHRHRASPLGAAEGSTQRNTPRVGPRPRRLTPESAVQWPRRETHVRGASAARCCFVWLSAKENSDLFFFGVFFFLCHGSVSHSEREREREISHTRLRTFPWPSTTDHNAHTYRITGGGGGGEEKKSPRRLSRRVRTRGV